MRSKGAVLLVFWFGLSTVLVARQIPAGIVLSVSLQSRIDGSKVKPGHRLSARVEQDVPLPQGRIPKGSRVLGRVVYVGDNGRELRFVFDSLQMKHAEVPIRTSLRAIASPTEVSDAQLPTSPAADRGTPPAAWTTRQVGGEVVYRGGGHVMDGVQVVGEPATDGILAPLRNAGRCRGEPSPPIEPQALWVFSSKACGVYGYEDLSIRRAGGSEPVGQVELSSTAALRLYSGTGLLLRVLP
jgi:hypothetical protein